jgi:hypothetical protein
MALQLLMSNNGPGPELNRPSTILANIFHGFIPSVGIVLSNLQLPSPSKASLSNLNSQTTNHKKLAVFWDVAPCRLTDVSDVLAASFIRPLCTSETLVNIYQTSQRNIPDDSHLHTRRRENLISHQQIMKLNICEDQYC